MEIFVEWVKNFLLDINQLRKHEVIFWLKSSFPCKDLLNF